MRVWDTSGSGSTNGENADKYDGTEEFHPGAKSP
jgi:hypothetical protein